MSNKKENIVKILIVLVVIAIVVVAIIFVPKLSSKDENALKLEKYEIANLVEVSKTVPDFKVDILGAYQGEFNSSLVKNNDVKMYEFDAGIDKDGKVETSKYVGFKLEDVVKALEIYEYSKLEFKSSSDDMASVVKDVDDNMFVVFMKDDKSIDVSLLIVNKPYDRSVEDLAKIFITNDYVSSDENNSDSRENDNDNPTQEQ